MRIILLVALIVGECELWLYEPLAHRSRPYRAYGGPVPKTRKDGKKHCEQL